MLAYYSLQWDFLLEVSSIVRLWRIQERTRKMFGFENGRPGLEPDLRSMLSGTVQLCPHGLFLAIINGQGIFICC